MKIGHPVTAPLWPRPSSLLSKSLVLALVGSACVVPSWGQDSAGNVDAQDDETPVVTGEQVEVAAEAPPLPPLNGIDARLPVKPVDLPASFSSVGQTVLADQTALVLSDALENIAGVNVQTGSANFDLFSIRGFDGLAGSLVLSDGAPEPESSFLHTYNVDRVEVLRGAAGGFLYGGRALAGTINLVRKQPAATDFTQFGLIGGSHGYWQATVDSNWRLSDTTGLRINGMWHTADNFRDDNESDAWAVHPTLAWRAGKTDLTLSLEAVSNEFLPDGGLPIVGGELADVDRERSYDESSDFFEQDAQRFQLNARRELPNGVELRAKVYYTDLDWQSAGTILAGVQPFGPTTLVLRSQSRLDDQQTFYGVQGEALFEFETGSIRHDIITGVEVSRMQDDFDLGVFFLAPAELSSGQLLGDPTPLPIPSQTRFGDVTSEVTAAYVVDRLELTDRLQVMLGGRFDQISFDGDGTAQDRDDDQFSPLAGVVLKANERTSFYVSYAESFEPQSTLAVGEVVPEEGEQLEAGIKLELWDGKGLSTFAWYELDKSNIAIVDQTGFQSQVGDQRSEGFELELQARLPGELELLFGYAYTDAELTEFRELVVFGAGPTDFIILDRSGNRPAFAPEHLANAWVSKRFGNGLGLGLGGRYLSDQFIAEDNTFAIDEAMILDAAVFFTWRDVQLNLNLLNLTDEEYETRAFGKAGVSPSPGFEIRAGLRYLL